ncbi:hypothetical protein BTA51_07885 [Hahella sp. CCB-MM4]|uniref:PA1571 family protein n=1 Tax=Hahella sp. (strain CCB-MM4) TaxID=1926491 RepID=UPI000B9BD778|nr:PA1571 family protein [Hahella sp. CCB-MM4]OZG73725.1 hypothetical protein BTA51_07885 [Hahella sp. CCB-MM4]
MYALNKEKMEELNLGNTPLNGAAIIDENGKEIPITETMIRQALKDLEHAWEPWHKGHLAVKVKR